MASPFRVLSQPLYHQFSTSVRSGLSSEIRAKALSLSDTAIKALNMKELCTYYVALKDYEVELEGELQAGREELAKVREQTGKMHSDYQRCLVISQFGLK